LLTDFGTIDPYVASMKGVLLSRADNITVVDITHEIAPQDVMGGAMVLAEAARWFPPSTVHIAVVDPGVGTAREPIAVRSGTHLFVGPNNGLLALAVRHPEEVRVLSAPDIQLASVSRTFHGRDLFAPAAAFLLRGRALADVGPPLDELCPLPLPPLRTLGDGSVEGEVLHVDHFGNLVTSLRAIDLPPTFEHIRLEGSHRAIPFGTTYSSVERGELVAYVGSAGWLEVAVREGSAAALLNARRGARARVVVQRGAR
jgi:hypothetical protein